MQINWFTVIAQVINFLVLVGLLKRFLYKPILTAIDEREKKIVAQLENAETKMAEAQKEQEDFKLKNEVFDRERKDLKEKAVSETKIERQKMLEEARQEAKNLSDKLELSMQESRENLNREISQKIKEEVISIAKKTLKDLGSASLEEQMFDKFIDHLNQLKPEEKKDFLSAFKSGSNDIVVQSAFKLADEQQQEIKNTTDKILGAENQIQFKTNSELISGIELIANGYKIGWNVAAYLSSFQKNISQTIEMESEKMVKKTDSKIKQEPAAHVKPES